MRPGLARREHRGDGEAELVDEVGGHEVAEEPRPALAQHAVQAAAAELAHHRGGGERVEHDDVGARGGCSARSRSAGASGPVSTIGATRVSVKRRAPGSRSAEPVTTAIGGGVGPTPGGLARAPVVLGAHGARADEDDLGELPEHAEHLAVGVAAQARRSGRRP